MPKAKKWIEGWPYRCRHCGKTVYRKSKKKWIKSWCSAMGKYTHIIRVVRA